MSETKLPHIDKPFTEAYVDAVYRGARAMLDHAIAENIIQTEDNLAVLVVSIAKEEVDTDDGVYTRSSAHLAGFAVFDVDLVKAAAMLLGCAASKIVEDQPDIDRDEREKEYLMDHLRCILKHLEDMIPVMDSGLDDNLDEDTPAIH
jgi:hypothetical protein